MVFISCYILIDTSFLVPLDLFLLYLPPLFAFMYSKTINHNRESLSYRNIIGISFFLTVIMNIMMIEAYYTFWLYFIIFNGLFFYVERLTLDRALGFRLSIYSCFALSVLWEWPIQLILYQNIDAVLMSGFKALGIIFLYLELKKSKFKFDNTLGFFISLTLFLGLLITLGINFLGIHSMFYITHAYRLPWIIIIFYAITITYKNLNKKNTNLTSGLRR